MKKFLGLFFLFLLVNLSEISAQKNTKVYIISGTVLNSTSSRPITFCHIYNESQRRGFISDSSGKFNSQAQNGDTIAFIALGYFGKTYVIQSGDTLPLKIKLEPRTYEIEAVTVGIPRTYSELKEAILTLDVNKGKAMSDLPKYNPYIRPQLLDTNVLNKPGFMIMHPVSGLYYKYNKEEISKRNVRYLQEQELKQPAVDAKYSREFVSKLTGLTGDDLNNFIGYCNFSFNYLYEATPLEIVEAIHRKYDQFLKCCYGKTENRNTTSE